MAKPPQEPKVGEQPKDDNKPSEADAAKKEAAKRLGVDAADLLDWRDRDGVLVGVTRDGRKVREGGK